MKKNLFMAGLILLFAACSSDKDSIYNDTSVPVRVHVNDFALSMDEFPTTRASAVTSYNGVKAITLAFYTSDGTEQYKVTQLRNDASNYTTFGDFELTLPLGSYTMVVLGYGKDVDDALVLTSPTQAEYTGAHTRETFAATQAVNINSTDAVELSATLNRIIAKLEVYSSDNRTANATNVRMTFSTGGKAFNPTSGLATVNTGFSNTVGISSAVGATTKSVSYLFLATDEQTANFTIETLDSDGNTLFTKTVNNVPFQRNRVTKLTGAMYDVSASATAGSFQLNTDWSEDTNLTF